MTVRLYDLDGTLYRYADHAHDPHHHDLVIALRNLGVDDSHETIS